MDAEVRSERRQRWQSDSSYNRDSSRYKLARVVRKHFTGRTLVVLLVFLFTLRYLSANWLVQSVVVFATALVGLRLVLVHLVSKKKRNRFVQLVDHQNVLGNPSEGLELEGGATRAERNV